MIKNPLDPFKIKRIFQVEERKVDTENVQKHIIVFYIT